MDTIKQANRRGWFSTLFALISFVIIFLIVRYSGFFVSVSFTTSDDGITFSGPVKESLFVEYDDIVSIDYIESPDYGTAVSLPSESADRTNAAVGALSGGTKRKCRYGTWESAMFGQYASFTLESIRSCVLIRTKSHGTVVFSIENDDSTRQFAESYSNYLKERVNGNP